MSRFADHFSGRAGDYAARRPTYPAELADVLAGPAPRRGVAWDAGCGSGQLSVLLAGRFDRVVATDASREQLAHARRHPRVGYRRERAEASSLPDASVDLAAAGQAAHWFDLDRYLAEVRRVCRPGGAVALVTYSMMRVDGDGGEVDRVVDAFHGGPLAPHWPAERRLVEESYAPIPFPFGEVEVPPLEMRERWTAGDVLGYVETWSAVGRLLEAGGGEALAAFRRRLREAWGDPGEVRTCRWPLSVRAGRIR